jgi:hypothetical protein
VCEDSVAGGGRHFKWRLARNLRTRNESSGTRSWRRANIALQIRQRAEQEIRRANKVLEQRTRALSQALVTMCATLESTTDAILVTDEIKVTDFNQKYIDIGRFQGGSWRAATLARCAKEELEFPRRRQAGSSELIWERLGLSATLILCIIRVTIAPAAAQPHLGRLESSEALRNDPSRRTSLGNNVGS